MADRQAAIVDPQPWWRRSRWPALAGLLALWVGGGVVARAAGVEGDWEIHLLYVPVVLAAMRFGLPGGIGMGVLAAVTAAGLDQNLLRGTPPMWETVGARLWPGIVFVLVGVLIGFGARAYRALHRRDLTSWWDRELAESRRADEVPEVLSDDDVRHAVSTGDFYPIFQPIYQLDDGFLFAVEALTRFDSDPPVPPSRWFAKAAELGLATELEIEAIRQSIASAPRFPERVVLSVNISATSVLDDVLFEVVTGAGRPMMLELTELEPVADYRRLSERLQRFRRAGVRIAVDNVGASMTSLRHLARLAPDVIKLDRVLTNDARSDPMRWALTKRLLHFARTTGAQLVVEGIEDPEDLVEWRKVGVHAAQGYLLGRPGMRTIVEQFEFPTVRARRSAAGKSRGSRGVAHPRDNVRFEDHLEPSQTGDEPVGARPETFVDPLRRKR